MEKSQIPLARLDLAKACEFVNEQLNPWQRVVSLFPLGDARESWTVGAHRKPGALMTEGGSGIGALAARDEFLDLAKQILTDYGAGAWVFEDWAADNYVPPWEAGAPDTGTPKPPLHGIRVVEKPCDVEPTLDYLAMASGIAAGFVLNQEGLAERWAAGKLRPALIGASCFDGESYVFVGDGSVRFGAE